MPQSLPRRSPRAGRSAALLDPTGALPSPDASRREQAVDAIREAQAMVANLASLDRWR
jgi:hypothetical protein